MVASKAVTGFLPHSAKIHLWTRSNTVAGVVVDCTRTELEHAARWNLLRPCLVTDVLAVTAECGWLQAG